MWQAWRMIKWNKIEKQHLTLYKTDNFYHCINLQSWMMVEIFAVGKFKNTKPNLNELHKSI